MDDDLLKTLKGIEFFLGAISSQLATLTTMLAADRGIPVTYWDPTIEPWPVRSHGEKADLSNGLKIGVPRQQRAKQD